jgi:UDP-galactopyranose mutase
MNACDRLTGWTRCTEHKFFTPWDTDIRGSIATLEFPRDAKGDDTLFYPLHYNEETKQLATYKQLAAEEERVVFLGRLGTYRYLNMDQCVEEAIVAARKFVNQA